MFLTRLTLPLLRGKLVAGVGGLRSSLAALPSRLTLFASLGYLPDSRFPRVLSSLNLLRSFSLY